MCQIIGHGGMGVVLKAFDRELKRCVAIKVLAPHLAQSSLAKKRFAREAQAAAAVVHPNVLAIHHVQPGGRLPFLVMPLVAGESLAERLAAQGTLEIREILRIGMQAAAGLAAAHEQGLVHRDVKPANILLEKGVERAVLTDFGLARAADDVALTRWGIIAGTPEYMSPEQARGEPLDGRSDLFSLGCVLYEMATGVSPFRADSMLATMRRLVDDPPQALAALNPELPPWFIALVDRLLEKDPSRRLGSAKEVSELLEGCLAHVQQPANVPLPAELARPARRRVWRPSVPRILGVIVMIAALGVGLLGILLATADPTDIAGEWSGEWGKVVLKAKNDAEYSGTYTDTFGKQPGEIQLKWSRLERRFYGTWREGEDRFGELSVRLVGDEIRGAHTTDLKSKINPATPRLADLLWKRSNVNTNKSRSTPAESDATAPRTAATTATPKRERHENPWPASFPKSLVERLASQKGWLTVPANAKVQELPDRFEITAAPWRTTQLLVDGDHKDEHAHDPDHKHDHAHDADHTRKLSQQEYFADEGKLIVSKDKDKEITLELIGNAGFEGSFLNYSAQSISMHLGGKNPRMILSGNARFANSSKQVKLSADRITIEEERALLEGNARVRRNTDSALPELILADRIELDTATNTMTTSGKTAPTLPAPRDESQPKTTNAMPKPLRHFQTNASVKTIACSADGKLIAIANGNPTFLYDWKRSVEILDAETGKTVVSLRLITNEEDAVLAATEGLPHFEVGPLAFSPDGTLLAVGTGMGQVKLFNARTGELVLALDDEPAKLAEQKTPEKLKSLKRAMGGVGALAFSPGGTLLAMCGSSFDDVARNWGGVSRLGMLATGPGRLKVWEVKTGMLLHDLVGHSHAEAVSFSADGNLLASAGSWLDQSAHGTGVIIWNALTGKKMRSITNEANGGTHSVVFSPDRNLVAIGSRHFDKENDTSTTTVSLAYALSGITEWKQTVPGWAKPGAFSPDGKRVAVLCGGQSIRFFETETGIVKHEINSADSPPGGRWNDFAITTNGHLLAIGGIDAEKHGFVTLWNLDGTP